MTHETALLKVRDLRIEMVSGTEIVDDVSFDVQRGEIFALVGESGCGKSSVALALMGYARSGAKITGGSVSIDGLDTLALKDRELNGIRGSRISYVPQDPGKALSPRRPILAQLIESMTVHGMDPREAMDRSIELLQNVELPSTDDFLQRYPFELSGGQQQRVLIAMALACSPEVVVLDEPTTALDATSQAKVNELIGRLAKEGKAAFVYVTHDLSVVQQIAHRMGVMYAGRLIETGTCSEVFRRPAHPYTVMLLRSVPSVSARRVLEGIPGTTAQPGERPSGCFFHPRCPMAQESCRESFPQITPAHLDGTVRCYRPTMLQLEVKDLPDLPARPTILAELEVKDLRAGYGSTDEGSLAIKGVSLSVAKGECLAIVGESGSGKSTTGRCIVGLHPPLSGSVLLGGEELAAQAKHRKHEDLRRLQVIFQNPDRSLNPSHTVSRIITRPMRMFGQEQGREGLRIRELMDQVRLSSRLLERYPAELSGGEKQRVAIARALAADPTVIVCDEITSALDVSIQAAIVEVLEELRDEGLAMLFITHNLGVVRSLADRTMVMRNGQVIEAGSTLEVIQNPKDPYTINLRRAVPELVVG